MARRGWDDEDNPSEADTKTSLEVPADVDAAEPTRRANSGSQKVRRADSGPKPQPIPDHPLEFTPNPGQPLASTEPSRVVPVELQQAERVNLVLAVLAVGVLAIAAVLALVFLVPWGGTGTTKVVEIPPQAYEDASGVGGVTETTVVLATLGGAANDAALGVRAGIAARLAEQNAAGGVNRRTLRLFEGGATAPMDLANALRTSESGQVFMFVGSSDGALVEQLVKQRPQTLVIGPQVITPGLAQAGITERVFHVRPSVQQEIAALIIHLVNALGVSPRRLALVHGGDASIEPARLAMWATLQEYKVPRERLVELALPGRVEGELVDLVKQRAQVDAVVALLDDAKGAELVRVLRERRFKVPVAFVSLTAAPRLGTTLRGHGKRFLKDILLTQVVPPPDSELPGVVRYRKALSQHAPQETPDPASLEGYLAASVALEGLARVEGGLTPATLHRSLEALQTLDLGVGAPFGFTPHDHLGSRKVWITQFDERGRLELAN